MLLGKKIYLSEIKEESLEALRVWRNDESLRVFFREYHEITQEMQTKWFNECVKNTEKQFNFEIRILQPDELIGHCSLNYVSWTNRTAEFGIYIGPKNMRGHGYGSDALLTLLRYGFNELGLNRIFCEVFSMNAAIETYRKIGFKDEGVLREHHFTDGKFIDSFMLGMLKREWNELHP